MDTYDFPQIFEKAPSGWKGAALFVPFLLLIVIELIDNLLPRTETAKAIGGGLSWLLFLGVVLLALLGVVKKLPGWALPNLGFVLAVANLFIAGSLIFFLDPTPVVVPSVAPLLGADPAPSWLNALLVSGLSATFYLLPVLLLIGMLILLSAYIPPLQFVFQRVQRDWSLITLLIYINYLLSSGITFDPPEGSGPYRLLTILILAAGAWLYFHSAGPWKRLAVLLVAAFLAQLVVAAGVYFLYTAPGSSLPAMLNWMITRGDLASLLGSLLPLLLPAGLAFLPFPAQTARTV